MKPSGITGLAAITLLHAITSVSPAQTDPSDLKSAEAELSAAVLSVFESAKWIGRQGDVRNANYSARDLQREVDKAPQRITSFPSPLLRKEFLVERRVARAQIVVCGLGLHEVHLNGRKVGNRVLSPAPTSYDKRAYYVTYDVTAELHEGMNAIGVWLGNGFFGQNFGFAAGLHYGRPTVKLALVIQYADGSSASVATDPSWRATQSPVLFDNIYGGETFDARLAQQLDGWSRAGVDAGDWEPAEEAPAPTQLLLEEEIEPIRKVRSVRPVAVRPTGTGEWIIDLGENMTGWVEMRLNESRGTVVEMRFAELLMPEGQAIDTASTGVHATGCEQRDLYICRGGGESWEPRFTYHGFRYVQVKGLSKKPNLDDWTGWVVRSDLRRVGRFSCSDPLINKFYEVSLRTIEGNVQGLLSDCPHRERCAWLGDMHAAAEAVSMNFDARRLWRKHINDFETTLGVAGTVPRHYPANARPPKDARAPANIACGKRLCGQARPDWGVAVVLIPWTNWLFYGDRESAKQAWPLMAGYMDFLREEETEGSLIRQGYAYGDWCPPGGNPGMDTSPQLTATALYYQSLCAMARMAALLSKPEAAGRYEEQCGRVKAAFNKAFFRKERGDYGSQSATAMALRLQLVPEGQQSEVASGLNRLVVEDAGGHYTTGILGHRHLYTALNDHGFGATTSKLWSHTTYPSLGFLVEKHGLTTWPEVPMDWPAGKRYQRNSFNHPMHSGFAVAFHESIGGIRPDPEHPGFEEFLLEPCFLDGLQWAKAEYDSPRGLISSSWEKVDDEVRWEITVPEDTVGHVVAPRGTQPDALLNGAEAEVEGLALQAGKWSLVLRLR